MRPIRDEIERIDARVANREPSGVKLGVLICAKVIEPHEIAGYLREARMVIYD